MDSDKRKEYNKKYYADNKATICGKLTEKEACDICGKMVNHQHVNRHQKSKACLRKAVKQALAEDKHADLKKQVNEIQNTLDKLNQMAETDPVMYCWGCQESFKESDKHNHKCKT
jgi:hypothetical protein